MTHPVQASASQRDNPCLQCEHLDSALNLIAERAQCAAKGAKEETPLDRLRRMLPGVVRTVEPGQHLTLEGDASDQVIGVLSGLVRCYRLTGDGRRHICRFAGPGSLIGLGLLGVQRHSAEAVAATQIIVFRMSAIEAAFERDACIRASILLALAEELTQRERVQLRLGRLTADQRVADFLIELAGPKNAGEHDIPMSRADIADHLGLTIETVSRGLHRFDKMQLIKLGDAHHFRLLRPSELVDFIEGDDDSSARRLPHAQRETKG